MKPNSKMLDGITSRTTLMKEFKKFKIPVHFINYDEEFKKPNKVGGYVINLGDELNGGTHWTCVYYDGKNEYYFDSYGMPAPQKVVDIAEDYFFNDTVIQDIVDERCGLYVFMFLLNMTYGKGNSKQKYKAFLKNFSKVLKKNHDIIGNMYLSLFK